MGSTDDLIDAMHAVFTLGTPGDWRPGVPDIRDPAAGVKEAVRFGLAAGNPPEWCAGVVRGFLTRGLSDSDGLWALIDRVAAEQAATQRPAADKLSA